MSREAFEKTLTHAEVQVGDALPELAVDLSVSLIVAARKK